ncbi:MAG TPA: HEAT repeat domain-containing protein [Bryobacteraceae bacterium]|nr:HEAT repeat domain-containing protein [Bryobacteraceae bacterium]
MNCELAKKNAALFLYGELTIEEEQAFQDHIETCADCGREFETEKRVQAALNRNEVAADPALLARSRRELGLRLENARMRRAGLGAWLRRLSDLRIAVLARPAAALALVALGFFGARLATPKAAPAREVAGLASAEPGVLRVRYLEPGPSGRVQLVVDETRQRTISGTVDDDQIRRLLLAAARESTDAGLRAESMDVLKADRSAGELRPVLLYALQHDSNPGVRLKALDALKPYGTEADVRAALTQVLLTDDNPGVRAQAIDLLVEHKGGMTAGVLQEVVQKENNSYVRLRCQRALEDMNASVGTF